MSESVLGGSIVRSSVSGSVSLSGVGYLNGNVSTSVRGDVSVSRSFGWSGSVSGSGSNNSSVHGIRSLASQRERQRMTTLGK